ncbi:MAG: hypothetical protein KUL79_05460, partial [Thauera sp.]|nr:hypothetical protein [Thauera sp.]
MTRKTKKTDQQRSGAPSRKTQAASRANPPGRQAGRSAPAAHAAPEPAAHGAPHHDGAPARGPGRSRAARKAAAVQASAVRLADPFYARET